MHFDNREAFRSWLEKNHDKSPGFWMIFHKKPKDIPGITYNEALEEALCFGWIDSIIKRVDEALYLRKFTPRINTSGWSDLNKKYVLSLIERGKMTKAGLEKIDVYLKTGNVDWKNTGDKNNSNSTVLQIPDNILSAFSDNEPALTNFTNLARSYKRQYILWIMDAKREETFQKRLKEAVELLKENRKLGMK